MRPGKGLPRRRDSSGRAMAQEGAGTVGRVCMGSWWNICEQGNAMVTVVVGGK